MRALLAAIALLAAHLVATPPARATFESELVDGPALIGKGTAITIDDAGNPHIAYHSDAASVPPTGLRYATRVGGSWQIAHVDSSFDPGGQECVEIRVDAGGDVHIVYFDGFPGNTVKYAKKSGGSWTIEPVGDTWSSNYVDLDLDPAGEPRIVYYATGGLPLGAGVIHCEKIGGSWAYSLVPNSDGFSGVWPSLAVDANGDSHVVYETSAGQVAYATRSTGWSGVQIVSSDSRRPTIAIDSQGRPHVAYGNWGLGVVQHAVRDGGVWTIETADTTSGTSNWGAIALDSQDEPHIVYFHEGSPYSQVMYATRSGGTWTHDVIRSEADGDSFETYWKWASIAIDAQDRPHITYLDESWLRDIYYAVLAPPIHATVMPVASQLAVRAFPNPWRGGAPASIRWSTARDADVTLEVLDVTGRRVRTLLNGVRGGAASASLATWDGRDTAGRRVASGTYLLRLRSGDASRIARILVVR